MMGSDCRTGATLQCACQGDEGLLTGYIILRVSDHSPTQRPLRQQRHLQGRVMVRNRAFSMIDHKPCKDIPHMSRAGS
jgi:hypothetical protein